MKRLFPVTMHLRRRIAIAGAVAWNLALCGCERAPSIDVLGSFFPSWIFCIVAGIALTVPTRFLLIRSQLDGEIGPGVIIYPCMAALYSFSIWLIFFRF